jgi:hypothetical protein
VLHIFRRRTVRDLASLATFIDEQSRLLSERVVNDYLRGRAGEKADALFADAAFRPALDKARWEARPRALAMIGEIAEGLLRPHAGADADHMRHSLTAAILDLFDRIPPPALPAADRQAARMELAHELGELADRSPRTIDAIAHAQASYYLAIMPLHALLSSDDFPALRNALNAMLAGMREQFRKRADLRALASLLAKHARPEASSLTQ